MDKAADEKLLPCPFCAGRAEFERLGTPRQSTIINCTECGCRLETGEEWRHWERWNKRAADAARAVGDEEVVEIIAGEFESKSRGVIVAAHCLKRLRAAGLKVVRG